MFAIAVTLALFGFAALMLASMVRAEGRKMMAAMEGRSWASRQSASAGPVTLRLSPRYPASRPMRAQAGLRAAA